MPRIPKQEIVKRNNIPEDKQQLFMNLRRPVLQFFMEYLKNGGSGVDAYIAVHRTKRRDNASWMAAQLLRSHPEIKRALYEMWGFGEKDFLKVLNDAKTANREQIYKNEVHVFPDHYARLKALELARKFKGDDTEEGSGGAKVNVMIVNDPAKGIFRVEDQS